MCNSSPDLWAMGVQTFYCLVWVPYMLKRSFVLEAMSVQILSAGGAMGVEIVSGIGGDTRSNVLLVLLPLRQFSLKSFIVFVNV